MYIFIWTFFIWFMFDASLSNCLGQTPKIYRHHIQGNVFQVIYSSLIFFIIVSLLVLLSCRLVGPEDPGNIGHVYFPHLSHFLFLPLQPQLRRWKYFMFYWQAGVCNTNRKDQKITLVLDEI